MICSRLRLFLILSLGICFFISGLELLFLFWGIFDYCRQKNKRIISSVYSNNFAGIYVFLFFLPIIIIVGMIGEHFLVDFEKQDSVNQLKNRVTELGFGFFFSVLILSPVFEEFYFRKILFNEICLHYGPFLAVLLTALLFSAVHFNIYAFPILFVLGLSLGVVKIFSANLLNSVLCHSFFNLFMLSQIIN
jgi:membrane protease YdiL (CAAX protease family)